LEGYPLSELEEMIQDSEALVILSITDGNLYLYFSENMEESTVLDMLSAATTKLYHMVDTDPNQTLH